jgi:MFS family permease
VADPVPLRALLRVAAATTLVVLSFSMLTPVLAVRLQTEGVSTTAIGAFAMLTFLSVALMVPLMPRVFARIGVARAYRLGLMLEMLATFGYALTDHYGLWCVLSALSGLGAAAAWNGTEALIAHNAPADRRGRFTGLYQTALGAALALGPFLPGLLPLSPRALSVLAAAMLLLAFAVTLTPGVSRLQASRPGSAGMGLMTALRRVPGLAWIALAGGVFEAGLGAVTAAYGSKAGLSLASAASIAGVLGVGSFLLQYPSGWLADHQPPRRVFATAGLLLIIGSLAFTVAAQWAPMLWLSAFVWGAVGGALYTLTMIRVAHDFADSSAVAGVAAMIVSYTLGASIGPAVGGWVLDVFGVVGQAAWLSVLAASVLVVALRMPGSRSARRGGRGGPLE